MAAATTITNPVMPQGQGRKVFSLSLMNICNRLIQCNLFNRVGPLADHSDGQHLRSMALLILNQVVQNNQGKTSPPNPGILRVKGHVYYK